MMNKRTKEKTGMKSYVLYLIPAFVIIVILVMLRTVLLLGYVPSESMKPKLERVSHIIGNRFYRDIDVGDIIIFEREGNMMVKRVAACAGDMVMVNGQSQPVPSDCFLGIMSITHMTQDIGNSRLSMDLRLKPRLYFTNELFGNNHIDVI